MDVVCDQDELVSALKDFKRSVRNAESDLFCVTEKRKLRLRKSNFEKQLFARPNQRNEVPKPCSSLSRLKKRKSREASFSGLEVRYVGILLSTINTSKLCAKEMYKIDPFRPNDASVESKGGKSFNR